MKCCSRIYNISTCIHFNALGLLLHFDETQNVENPGLSHFERCELACMCLLTNLHLHFAFRQSKATLPLSF